MNRTTLILILLYFISAAVQAGTFMRKFLRRKAEVLQSTRRPIIHTFACEDESNVINSEGNEFILEWAEAWSNSGWDTLVLTEKDAKLHPKYEQYMKQLTDAKVPPIRQCRYLHYLAMSVQEDGGWYADLSMIPMAPAEKFNGGGFALPNGGKLTMYDGHFVNLLSGNRIAWELFSDQMMNNLVIKNDVVLLSLLMHKNPGMYFKEDSVIHVNDILFSNLKPNVNCTVLENKIASSVSDVPVGERTKIDYYNAINAAMEECKPVMYTFYENAYNDRNSQELVITDLEEWKKAWKESGWRPVVLSLEDAKRHPEYKELEEIVNSGAHKGMEYEKMCFYRWLAVAAKGGGWMADIDAYPLHMEPKIYGNSLPYEGKFTSHCSAAPCLVSGSEVEWNRVIPLILGSLKKHNDEHWSDMFAMQEVIDQEQIIREMGHANIHDLHNPALLSDSSSEGWKNACDASKDKLVVHFSHYSCKIAEFCHNKRGATLNQWLDDWKAHCAVGASEE